VEIAVIGRVGFLDCTAYHKLQTKCICKKFNPLII
jgi:hypothetical protein